MIVTFIYCLLIQGCETNDAVDWVLGGVDVSRTAAANQFVGLFGSTHNAGFVE
jgi:hypothetical protein